MRNADELLREEMPLLINKIFISRALFGYSRKVGSGNKEKIKETAQQIIDLVTVYAEETAEALCIAEERMDQKAKNYELYQ